MQIKKHANVRNSIFRQRGPWKQNEFGFNLNPFLISLVEKTAVKNEHQESTIKVDKNREVTGIGGLFLEGEKRIEKWHSSVK